VKEENRARKRDRIERAAYELLAKKGYAGTSMLAIATRAKASNETLYRWYGDKRNLFRTMIEKNAGEVRLQLESDLAENRAALETLHGLGPNLLSMLVSEKAILLNRAAAADASGVLGATIAEAGRETVAPLIARVFLRARDDGLMKFAVAGEAVSLYLDLLVGDLQIRRAIGSVAALTPGRIAERAEMALERTLILLAP